MSANPFMDPPMDSDHAWLLDQGRRLIASANVEPGDLVSLTWTSKVNDDPEPRKISFTGTFDYWGESVHWIEIKGPKSPGHYRMPIAALHRVTLERKGKLPDGVAATNPFAQLGDDTHESKYKTAIEDIRTILFCRDVKVGDFVVAKIRKGSVDDNDDVEEITGTVKDLTHATIIIDGQKGEPKVYRQTHLAMLADIQKMVKNKHDDDCLRRRDQHPLLCTCDLTDEQIVQVENPFMHVNNSPANPFMI